MPPSFPPPIVLFDGHCNLCNRSVQFIIRHEQRAALKFAGFNSPEGRRILVERGIEPLETPRAMMLLRDGRLFEGSTAALQAARYLKLPWRVLMWLIVIPAPAREAAYEFIAARRYRWFGRTDACMMPTPQLAGRFFHASADINVPVVQRAVSDFSPARI